MFGVRVSQALTSCAALECGPVTLCEFEEAGRNDLVNIVVTVFMELAGSPVFLQQRLKWDFKRPLESITGVSEG